MLLTTKDIHIILDALAKEYGPGYSRAEGVGSLQAKLSMMLEVAAKREKELAVVRGEAE
jgi:hypothetical protein